MRFLSLFKSESPLQQVKYHLEAGRKYDAFAILLAEYARNPAPAVATELSNLIGTTSSYEDVRAAMDSEFDNSYYLNVNQDVADAIKDGHAHYLLYGWKEGRNPSAIFDHAYYKARNRDLEKEVFPLSHFVKVGKPAGLPTNPIGNDYWFKPFLPSEDQWASLKPATVKVDTEAIVIVPVYEGLEETMTAIYQAVASRGNDNYGLLVVNDKSPNDVINATLSSLAERGLFEYYSSVLNRGFVQTCNFALKELSRNLDVVLLNSDAYVFPGWFGRLKAHAEDPSVATVTPLSNNATICSYPLINHDNALTLECSPQELDAIASSANKGLAVETPTGVGFCFYMKRAVIDKIGAFDADAFKVGYGEENDFCMRALNNGYKNLIAGDVFVFHTGSVSFSATKEENVSKGQQALEMKHPNYSSLVSRHLEADPERFLRRRLDISRLSATMNGATIFVSHRWGGGVDTYLVKEREKLKADKVPHITLLVHDGHRVTVDTSYDLFVPNLADIDLRCEFDVLVNLIDKLVPKAFHVNSFAGIEWHWHKSLLKFIKESRVPYKYVCHDYSSVSHHYNLLRPDFMYVADPTIVERRAWSTMIETGAVDICDPDERIAVYSDFLSHASAVDVPSDTAKAILVKEFPSIAFKVVPHADHLPNAVAAKRRKRDKRIRIVTIGAIGPHKGSDVLAALAADAKNRNLELDYTVVGYTNIDEQLKRYGVSVTGRYQSDDEAMDLIADLKPDLVLIPSICAETFCFALSMALKMKIPPVVFDIGAQAERVAPLAWGTALPIKLAYSPSELSEALLNLDMDKLWSARDSELAS